MRLLESNVVGSPYELGYQHGQQMTQVVRACFTRFCCQEINNPGAREHLALRIEENMARQMPEVIEEMRGIADGCGMRYEEIRMLNFSVELQGASLYEASGPCQGSAKDCTLIGFSEGPEGPLVAKTMDLMQGDEALIILQRFYPTAGYSFVHVTYAGTTWTDGGVNQKGLAQVNSALETTAQNWTGLPVFILARHLLQRCATVEEAVTLAAQFDAINYGSNILLADASGSVAVIEMVPTRQAMRRLDGARMDRQVIFATNHSITPEMEAILGGSEALLRNSRERYAHLTKVIRSLPLTLLSLQKLLRDHSQPGGLCQHGQGGLHTIGSFIASATRKKMWMARGAPCQNPFVSACL